MDQENVALREGGSSRALSERSRALSTQSRSASGSGVGAAEGALPQDAELYSDSAPRPPAYDRSYKPLYPDRLGMNLQVIT